MKIIDLLNKIANGEEVPKKVKYKKFYWEYKEERKDYKDNEDDYVFCCSKYDIPCMLGNEVEIIEEEKKIPEKIKFQIHHSNLPNLTLHEEQLEKNENTLVDCFEEVEKKLNEIIDYLKSKGE